MLYIQLLYAQLLSTSDSSDCHANAMHVLLSKFLVCRICCSLHSCVPQGAWHSFMQEEGVQQIFAERVRGMNGGRENAQSMHDELRQS